MELKYDEQADAAYIYLSSKPYAYGRDLDDERRIDYASDNTQIGVELLYISKGVNVDGLPQPDEIANLLETKGIRIYAMASYNDTALGYAAFDVRVASPAEIEREAPSAALKEEATV